jgi:thiamine biosynthesis lipoprotein
MQLDLGGIAKGFAADEAAAVLTRCGIGAALVAVGGDIVATGPPPGRDGWRVAVASIEGAGRPAGYINLRDAAVSTSGDAEQFVVLAGVRYSHVFDPRTGAALTGRRSATVVARDGITADALDTAVAVMGAVKGLALVESTPGAAAFVVEETGGVSRTYESSRWRADR